MRKIIRVTFLIVFVCVCSYSFAEDTSDNKMIRMGMNGDYWRGVQKFDNTGNIRIALIRGIYEGLWYSDVERFLKYYHWQTSYELLTEALDKFYSNDKNLKVYIAIALEIISAEIRGEDKKMIEYVLQKARKTGAEAVEEASKHN